MEDRCCYSVFIIVYHNTQGGRKTQKLGEMWLKQRQFTTLLVLKQYMLDFSKKNRHFFFIFIIFYFSYCIFSKLNDNNNLWNVSEDECLCQPVHYIIITTIVVHSYHPHPKTSTSQQNHKTNLNDQVSYTLDKACRKRTELCFSFIVKPQSLG